MDEGNYTVEDRVHKCSGDLCSNILHIQVHICKNSEVTPHGRLFATGDVRYVTAVDESEMRLGCCISHSLPYPHKRGQIWWRRTFTYGPVEAYRVTLVHCKRCWTRVGWKKFKKVVV